MHQARAEALDDARGFDCVTSRAFASLADMIRVSGHLLAPGGCLLAMKASLDEEEVAAVDNALYCCLPDAARRFPASLRNGSC